MVLDRRIAAVGDTALELEAGALGRIANHVRTIDAFALHRREQRAAHRVGTEPAGPTDFQPEARQADRHIGFGTGGALVKQLGVFNRPGSISHQQQHGLTEQGDVERGVECGHGRGGDKPGHARPRAGRISGIMTFMRDGALKPDAN